MKFYQSLVKFQPSMPESTLSLVAFLDEAKGTLSPIEVLHLVGDVGDLVRGQFGEHGQ